MPTAIPDNCSSNATEALNAFFATIPTQITVEFPDDGCYLVSQSATSGLLLAHTTSVTIVGNGSTLEQTSYKTSTGANGCGKLTLDPILTLDDNVDLAVNDLTIKGPMGSGPQYNCVGDLNEGDTGLLIGGADSVGNHGVTFTGVTVENTDGDGVDIYPHLATNSGANTDIVFRDGRVSNWGWFGVVGEGVSGFSFSGNDVEGKRFMDVEVDNSCFVDCLNSNGSLRGDGVDNMVITNNHFDVDTFLFAMGGRGCTPENNWSIQGNNFGTGDAGVSLDGSYGNLDCPTDNTGFKYIDNSGGLTGSSCGASYGAPPAYCAGLNLAGWADVTIAGNSLGFPIGIFGSRDSLSKSIVTTTAGTSSLVSPTGQFTESDVGDLAVAADLPLGDALATVRSSTTATLTRPATSDRTSLTVSVGTEAYFPNTPLMQAVGLCDVSHASITGNLFAGADTLWNSTRCFDASGYPAESTGVMDCGNAWGLTNPQPYYWTAALIPEPAPQPDPRSDAACSNISAPDLLLLGVQGPWRSYSGTFK